MALAPADFYAYSNATGVPVPEDPEERARMAPEVLEFRRNQLKAPESKGPDPLSIGIGIGLAAAGLGAGAYGIRKFLQARGATNIPKQPGKSGISFADLETVPQAKPRATESTPRPSTPPPGPTEVDIHQAEIPTVAVHHNETVDSGAQQFLQRRLEEKQRNTSPLDQAIAVPQEERNYAPSKALPASRRPLREEKILNRLSAEQSLLEKSVLSSAPWHESLLSSQTPEGIVNYPSSLVNAFKGEEVNLLGPSSPLRETYSAFAQIDPEMIDRHIQGVLNDPELSSGQKEGAIYRLQQLKQASEGVRGEAGVTALALSRQGRLPYTSLLDEPISGIRGEMRETLNPAYVEAMRNYWERRAAELPHTITDYEKRKAAGLLNYQLPEAQRTANNRAQTFGGWDKATSEALQEIYESEVGDIPQYITEVRPARGEEARARLGEQEEYTGGLSQYFEVERPSGMSQPVDRRYLPVYQPQVYPGMRKIKGEMVGFPSYVNLSSLTSNPPVRYKGPETGHVVDTIPLELNALTENEIAPGVVGQFKTTELVHVPLQRVELKTDPDSGKITQHLVDFEIHLDHEISPYVAALVGVPPRTSIQNAVRSIIDLNRGDYPTINNRVNVLLRNTVGDTPIMTQKPFDQYDEARREFINMLSGSSYETQQKGFLVGVNGQELPFTGPQNKSKSAVENEQKRRTNIIEARRQLSAALESSFKQQGLNSQEISERTKTLVSQYLPGFDASGVITNVKPQPASQERRASGQPLPDIMQRPVKDEGIRSAYYPRIEATFGGSTVSTLRTLLSEGAKIQTDPPHTSGAQVHYVLGDKKISWSRKELIDILKKEGQDAPGIAKLTGITLKTEGQVVSGPHQTLSSRETGQPNVSPTQRSAKPGYYYNEFGELMQEPTVSTFTGPARFAAGPASDVLSGSYPQGGSRVSVRTSPSAELQEYNRYRLAAAAEATPGGRMVRGGQQLGLGMGAIPAGLGALTESEVIQRYGTTGSQLQQMGNQLMAQAAYKRGQQPGATELGVKTGERNIPTSTVTPFFGPGEPPQQRPDVAPLGTSGNRELKGYTRRLLAGQLSIPGMLDERPLLGYTPNTTLDFYEKALAREAQQLASKPITQRMVRRQGKMVPMAQANQPIQRNVFFPHG